MTQSNVFHVVDFQAQDQHHRPDGPREIMLITDEQYDRWCDCEPPQGYIHFNRLHTFEVEFTSSEALERLRELTSISFAKRIISRLELNKEETDEDRA